MARIKTYTLDSQIDPADKVIGSDGQVGVNFGKTKNFSIGSLQTYFGSDAIFTKKIILENAQIADLGTSKTLVEISGGNSLNGDFVQLLGAAIEIENSGAAESSYTFGAPLIIGWGGNTADDHMIIIPTADCPVGNNSNPSPTILNPEDNQGKWRRGENIYIFEKENTNPTAANDPISKMAIHLTYRIFDSIIE
jgi:hypothetical protein